MDPVLEFIAGKNVMEFKLFSPRSAARISSFSAHSRLDSVN